MRTTSMTEPCVREQVITSFKELDQVQKTDSARTLGSDAESDPQWLIGEHVRGMATHIGNVE